MGLVFEIGSQTLPKGHALVYFRSASAYTTILATYVVVPPIRLDLSKYIPPMFAAKATDPDTANLPFVAIPPIPEPVDSYEWLRDLTEMRDDDLVFAGTADTSRPDTVMLAVNQAAREYGQLYTQRSQPTKAQDELSVQDVLFSLMSEPDRLGEIAKLTGKLRYAMGGNDTGLIRETVREMRALGQLLPEKYKIDELIEAAQIPGEKGTRLAALYIDRCYRLSNEEYSELARVEAEIKVLKSAEQPGGQ
ncbi:MAG: hypothetical protein HYY30_14215 [Chloroflexi bacterium]|nr:hypothetical protein [Chloroflexota bacterium]